MPPFITPPTLLLQPIYQFSQQATGEESNSWLVGGMFFVAVLLVITAVLRRRRP